MYHGSPAERAELRRTKMTWYEDAPSSWKNTSRVLAATKKTKQTDTKRATRSGKKSTRESKRHSSPSEEQTSRRSTRLKTVISPSRFKTNEQPSDDVEDEAGEESYIPDGEINVETDTFGKDSEASFEDVTQAGNETNRDDMVEDRAHNSTDSRRANDTFPIIITTYEMVIKDRQHLSKYNWNFIVVDEGHRLKNMDCKYVLLIVDSGIAV